MRSTAAWTDVHKIKPDSLSDICVQNCLIIPPIRVNMCYTQRETNPEIKNGGKHHEKRKRIFRGNEENRTRLG